jgi:hypothetical protein
MRDSHLGRVDVSTPAPHFGEHHGQRDGPGPGSATEIEYRLHPPVNAAQKPWNEVRQMMIDPVKVPVHARNAVEAPGGLGANLLHELLKRARPGDRSRALARRLEAIRVLSPRTFV